MFSQCLHSTNFPATENDCAFGVETNALAASFTRAVIFMGMDFLGKPSDHR
jgi:hypothetical protein